MASYATGIRQDERLPAWGEELSVLALVHALSQARDDVPPRVPWHHRTWHWDLFNEQYGVDESRLLTITQGLAGVRGEQSMLHAMAGISW